MFKRTLILCLVVIVSTLATFGDQQPIVSMSLIPERQLPGLPFELRLTVTNVSQQPISVWDTATLFVDGAKGAEEKVITAGREDVSLVLADEGARVDGTLPQAVEVLPKSSVMLLIPISEPLRGALSSDLRFIVPGRYVVRAEIAYRTREAESVARSNDVEVEIIAPKGEDKLVWDRIARSYSEVLRAHPDYRPFFNWNDWVTPQAGFIFENARQSTYFPYVAGANPEPRNLETTAQRLEFAIREWPDLPVTSLNRAALAKCADELIRPDASEESIRRNYARLVRATRELEETASWKGHIDIAAESLRTVRASWSDRAPKTVTIP